MKWGFNVLCSLLNVWSKVNNPEHHFLPYWLLSSILWGSIWRASDPAPYRCVHYLSEEDGNRFSLDTLCVIGVCVCVHVYVYCRWLYVCVGTEKSSLNAPCSKTASEASHQTSSSLPFVLEASGAPAHFFTSLCHVLICSWSDDFPELQGRWADNSEFLHNENSLKSKSVWRAEAEPVWQNINAYFLSNSMTSFMTSV